MTALDMVGNTPLIELKNISIGLSGVSIWAKAEFRNLSGSVNDRAARAMLLEGIESGALQPGKTIIDASSDKTGIYDCPPCRPERHCPQNAGGSRKRQGTRQSIAGDSHGDSQTS